MPGFGVEAETPAKARLVRKASIFCSVVTRGLALDFFKKPALANKPVGIGILSLKSGVTKGASFS